MKANLRCPKCESTRIGALPIPAGDGLCTVLRHQPVGMEERRDGLDQVYAPMGKLEAWVCAECGYMESYITDPSTVPFERLVGFRWIHEQTEDRGPYR